MRQVQLICLSYRCKTCADLTFLTFATSLHAAFPAAPFAPFPLTLHQDDSNFLLLSQFKSCFLRDLPEAHKLGNLVGRISEKQFSLMKPISLMGLWSNSIHVPPLQGSTHGPASAAYCPVPTCTQCSQRLWRATHT